MGGDTGNFVEFTLRGGINAEPEYFGSEDLAYGPDFNISDVRLRFAGREFGGGDAQGFGVHGAFRYIGARDASAFSELSGLDDVDLALELGVGLGYTSRAFEAFADLRYGVVGHESLVAEFGADAVFRPTNDLTMRFGPRLLLGSEDYTQTYFGVSAAEAAASGGRFAAFDADAGPVSAGVELGVTYQINQTWGIDGAVTYEQFIGSAADSPIVSQGTADQTSVRLGITRSLSLDF
ncbi:MltA-interacting protein MipA [Roseisalinus antarcticus]|uniref:MltA-interacting protein MipA n=2 Tax=Roseisalinus antarcticus TaxID=254357 RepID=A0A1Y5SY63_9RHOB|nr:MltA-interacting protein MipA [Roseisalinus antarcticus]